MRYLGPLHLLSDGAGKRGLVITEVSPDFCQRWDEHSEAEGPHEDYHEEDVGLGVNPAVVGVARNQNIPLSLEKWKDEN